MPLFLVPLIGWLSTAIVSALTYFATRKGILFAVMVGVIAIVGAATNALVSTVDGLIGSVLPSSAGFVAGFAPDNLALCLSSIIATHLICTGYRLTIKFIRWKTDIMTS